MKRWTRKLLAGLLSFGMLLQAASPLSALAAEGGTQGGTLSILCAGELLATMNREANGTLSWENAYNPFEGVQIEYDAASRTYKFEGRLNPPKNGYMTMKTDSTEDSIYIDGGAQNAVNGTVYIGTNESPVKNVIITSSNSEATVKEMAVIRATGDVELLNTGGGKVAEQAVSYCKAQSVSIVGGSSNVPTADVYIWVEDAFGDVNITNNAEDGLIAGGRVRVKADGNVGIKGGIAKTSRNTTESTVISGRKVTFDANASSANALKDMSLTVTADDAVTLKSHSSNSFLSGEKAYIDVTAPSLTVGNDGSGVIDGTVKFTRTNTTDDYRVAVGESESNNTQTALTDTTYSETVNAKYLNIQPGTPENTDPDDKVTNYGITVTIGNNPPIEVTSENCGKILGDGNDKLTYNPNTYTLTGKGSFGRMKVEITSDDQVDVVLSNANGTVVNGNLTVTGAQDVEVTGVSSTALITEDATITCDGDILMENTGTGNVIGTHDETNLAVNKASSVTIKNMGTEGNRSYAIYGRADITCSGNVEIVSSNGMAIWDPIVVTGAEDVKIKAAGRAIWDGRGDPDTIMTKIECSGKVEITSDTAAALHEGNLIIKGATDVAISGKRDDGATIGGDAEITCSGAVTLENKGSGNAVSGELKYTPDPSTKPYEIKAGTDAADAASKEPVATKEAGGTFSETVAASYINIVPAGSGDTTPDDTGTVDSGSDAGGAVAAVLMSSAAVWGGYEIATRVILHNILPEGTAIPANRGQLALLVWNNAGRPAPVNEAAFVDMDDADMAKAAQWCVEQGIMEAKTAETFKPEGWMPKFKVIEVWNKAFPKQ